jgi:Ca2+-transporting ATPase
VNDFKELDELPFSSDRKMMSCLMQIKPTKFDLAKNNRQIFTKGAFEEVIKKCSFILENNKIRKLNAKDIEMFSKFHTRYSEDALRVLGFAYKDYTDSFDENDLIFVGLVGMIDPPREDVPNALALAKAAGIQVKIITGDNHLTARAIAKRIGLPH